ncbi:MAG: hypothetical protein ABIQ89_01785 [Candidatus Saccharimonadales bacterium]
MAFDDRKLDRAIDGTLVPEHEVAFQEYDDFLKDTNYHDVPLEAAKVLGPNGEVPVVEGEVDWYLFS